MRISIATALALSFALLLAGCDAPPGADSTNGAKSASAGTVVLTQSEFDHLGVATEAAKAAIYRPQVHGFGTVLNASSLAQMDANIEAAAAAVLLSQATLDRAHRLAASSGAIAATLVDADEHQATADQVQQSLVNRQEVATFGADAPWRGPPRNRDMLAKLTSGALVIVQATFPLDVRFSPLPPSLTIVHLSEAESQASDTSSVIWRAPADPTIPGQSFYTLLDARDLEQGEHVIVYAPTGPAMSGVRIPAEAMVLTQQKEWCYVLVAPLTFRRVPLDLTRPLEGGYFLEAGVAPNAPVLVKGTGLLLARELGTSGYGQD